MTLIVARRDQETNKLYFVGDTRKSDSPTQRIDDPFRTEFGNGVFKFAKFRNIFVAFSGLITEATDLIRAAAPKYSSVDELTKYLSLNQKDSEFLVSAIESNGNSSLFKVQEGKVSTENSGAWIGSIEGFCEFQRYFHYNNGTISFPKKLRNCMEQVIQGRKATNVGGLAVVANQGDANFFFETGLETSGFPWVFDNGTASYGVGLGSSEVGTFTLESCEYEEVNILYYFFHQPIVLIIYKSDGVIFNCILNSSFQTRQEAEHKLSEFVGRTIKFCWG